jgi:hypothetical protein
MLKEIPNVKQPEPDSTRRWFTDSFFDLIVWYDLQQRMTGFQLCYDKGANEHAFTWKKNEGFSHHCIDDGEVTGRSKMTPILVQDGAFDRKTVADRFLNESGSLESEIRELVYGKILES